VNNTRDLFRINVGFIIHETVGYSRKFEIDIPAVNLSPDLALTNFSGILRISRTAQGLLLQANMRANSQVECGRCLEPFVQPLEVEFTELYAFSANSVTESGLLVPETGVIDLSPIIREEMLLAFPLKPICQPDCKGLCPICGENRNLVACDHTTEVVDSPLGVLKLLPEDQ